jgi:hypothetical protein
MTIKHINTLRGRHVQFLDVKPGGTTEDFKEPSDRSVMVGPKLFVRSPYKRPSFLAVSLPSQFTVPVCAKLQCQNNLHSLIPQSKSLVGGGGGLKIQLPAQYVHSLKTFSLYGAASQNRQNNKQPNGLCKVLSFSSSPTVLLSRNRRVWQYITIRRSLLQTYLPLPNCHASH